MPLYEYRCQKCGRQVEKIQKFSDPLLKTCEHCGGRLERLVSVPAIQFKGSGWYVTDYARKSAPAGAGKAESSEKGGSQADGDKPSKKTSEPAKTETASDKKPAASK